MKCFHKSPCITLLGVLQDPCPEVPVQWLCGKSLRRILRAPRTTTHQSSITALRQLPSPALTVIWVDTSVAGQWTPVTRQSAEMSKMASCVYCQLMSVATLNWRATGSQDDRHDASSVQCKTEPCSLVQFSAVQWSIVQASLRYQCSVRGSGKRDLWGSATFSQK